MNNIENILAEIIKSLHTNPQEVIRTRKLPGFISTPHDGFKLTNDSIERNIRKVADLMYEQTPNVHQTHLRREWRSIVRRALGQSLPPLGNNIDNYRVEANRLKPRLENNINNYTSVYDNAKAIYGCWLISPPPAEPIQIGPVHFEDKSSWLDRAFDSKKISKITHSRLSRALTGKRLKRRKPSEDQNHEEIICRQISNAPMICEIATHGLSAELAYKRSMIAVNLALTSIAMIWGNPSQLLGRFRTTLDHEPRSTYHVLIEPKKYDIFHEKRKDDPFACEMSPKVWKDNYNDARCFLKIAGEMICCWTNTAAYEEASPLLRSLSQSLFLFWKACRERSDILSIIEFVAVMETLAPERNRRRNRENIFKLIEARLGLDRDQKFTSDKTVEQIIDDIYGTARNKTLHGANPKLHYDWSNTRDIAERIARGCLVECMIMAQDNWRGKDKCFLLTDRIAS